jgi:hypothetical protein
MKAEGVNDLSQAVARSICASTSTPALREKVAADAERWLGAPLSLDLFAGADKALVPRLFSRFPEPLAEGVDALAQPDWGRSCCLHCGALHRECVFAFLPRALLPAFVAKARADGLRGIVIAPFTPSDPAWPALASASLTVIDGQKDRCLILPNSAQFRRLRRGGPERRSASGHPGCRLQSLVLAVVGQHSRALCGPRGAPAAAFASELARRGGSSAHRAACSTGARAAG